MVTGSLSKRAPIRIARIVTRMNIGGPALHLVELASRLESKGYEQRLLTGVESADEGSMLDLTQARGVDTVVIPSLNNSSRMGTREARAVVEMIRELRRFRPHIVETHTIKAGLLGRLAARAARVPAVVHVIHAHVDGYYGPTKTKALWTLERVMAWASTRILTISELVKRKLVTRGVAPAEKISVVPLGFDLSAFAEAERGGLRAELGVEPNVPLVGIVGRIFPIKNHRLFLDAASRVAQRTDAHFVVVGDGGLRPEMEQRAQSLGLQGRAHFLGWRRDMPGICADLDLLVVSSDNEGTPVAAIEAMAAGCPVVSTRVGGVPDLVADGVSGLLTRPGDADDLADAIARVLTDRELASQMGAAGQRIALDRFSVERLVDDMDRLYRELLV